MTVVPAGGRRIRRITVWDQPKEKALVLTWKIKYLKLGALFKVAKRLLSKYRALSSNPSTTKNIIKKNSVLSIYTMAWLDSINPFQFPIAALEMEFFQAPPNSRTEWHFHLDNSCSDLKVRVAKIFIFCLLVFLMIFSRALQKKWILVWGWGLNEEPSCKSYLSQ
jgi:hypothetical protein